MKIIVDSREKDRKQRAKDFYIAKGHDVKVERLDVGDYVFDDKVCFEYKDISDYMASIKNESLFNEASNQALKYPFHYVIVVADVRNYLNAAWPFARKAYNDRYDKYLASKLGQYYGALRRLRCFTTPIELSNEKQAFDEMLHQSIKCLDGKSKFYSNVTRPVQSQDPVDVLLTSCKGISTNKAQRIRKHHQINNIYDLMNLTVEDFEAVNSIGKKTATNIYNFIHTGEKNKK